eukprot:TRINITY_DN3978_c1_g1_i3.p1 TRINITY_DN3978_c1_g1~~TRINITY_DN3978_c1_g1_i3.p1  ORF type:complete len:327 (+),score=124.50 TRINITY_DN3978_c1_g1_i3:224-1204(+)
MQTQILKKAEMAIANYLNKEDALIFGMGFATNSTGIPSLISKGDLILSDSLNHASLVIGMRCSGAVTQVFKHNKPKDLESKLKQAIYTGQPKTGEPWKKIIIVIEGIFSMEGAMTKLRQMVELKKKYKAYLYLDEAHSIGAIGPNGKGVCDYFNVPTSEIDIMMGTFTKSFASAGGYICGSKALIETIRANSYSFFYDNPLSAGCCEQIVSSLDIIVNDPEGKIRINRLKENTNYMREKLIKNGFTVFGRKDSPIIPIMIYSIDKIGAFSRLCLNENVAVVVAGYPATPLFLERARLCVSASHTKEDLDKSIEVMTRIGRKCGICK